MKKNELPKTDSIQELANFWDNHDLMDYEDQLEEVDEVVFKKDTDISVHLALTELESLDQLARKKGVSDSELVHEWIREKLQVA